MESYLVEAFDKFLEKHLEFINQNPQLSYPSSADQLKGGFADDLWERMEQYIKETDWDELWDTNEPEKED